jgi:hypothetical protein
MPLCECQPVTWNNRRAYRLSNGAIELTILLGGGHFADFRLSGSPINILWEASWPTIDPHTFDDPAHSSLYGDAAVGKFLSGYTGHAVVVGNFGMPSPGEASRGVPLHGEAASSEWKVVSGTHDDRHSSLLLEVALPYYQFRLQREIVVAAGAFTASITETVTNLSAAEREFQWVQHASFGEPFLTREESSVFVEVSRAITWPLGYEGHELLRDDAEFLWPNAPASSGGAVDLTTPFSRGGTGFVASLLTSPDHPNAAIVVHNRRHALAAGYSFERARFPWIALWEENRARHYAPWNGNARVRGVEFGTSPMPLGIEQARETQTLFDTPVLARIGADAELTTAYDMFVTRVPSTWKAIAGVERSAKSLAIRSATGEKVRLLASDKFH